MAERGTAIDKVYWLGPRVRPGRGTRPAAKIVFFGFFRSETDALDAVT